MTYSATYSPEDNKIRVYGPRFDQVTYERVKALGFRWAPKQELWVAPMWTPEREDFATELAGEIGDEDTSLVERAEQRAERFEEYGENRMRDAESARKAVAAIADNIPLGQPILVNHHSEKHARRDAAKIENGMRRAVNMWETSKYWVSRAAGALAAAKYKELPAVRHRRIKTLGAEKRKVERTKAGAEGFLHLWIECGNEPDKELQAAVALRIANACWLHLPRKEGDQEDFPHSCTAYDALTNSHPSLYAPRTLDEIVAHAQKVYPQTIARCERWITHYENRLTYETAMLTEAGAANLLEPKPRLELVPLLNYRAAGGAITTENQWDRGREITYPQVDMTKAQYAAINKDYRGARIGPDKLHRFRTAMVRHSLVSVFLTDSKAHEQPAAVAPKFTVRTEPPRMPAAAPAEEPNEFDAMRQSLRQGVQVVTVPNLFPTPPAVAAQLVGIAGVSRGDRVLEPSAGTGALLEALAGHVAETVAVEQNLSLCDRLRKMAPATTVHCGDFLELDEIDLGTFDKVLMNPPFDHGADIRHVEHALGLLRPGGRLVAIVANGPRQQDRLMSRAAHWEELPAGTFAGTGVRAAICVIESGA